MLRFLLASPCTGPPLQFHHHRTHEAFSSSHRKAIGLREHVVVVVSTIELRFFGLQRRAGESGPSRRERLRAVPHQHHFTIRVRQRVYNLLVLLSSHHIVLEDAEDLRLHDGSGCAQVFG
jgi:hypothetical protein